MTQLQPKQQTHNADIKNLRKEQYRDEKQQFDDMEEYADTDIKDLKFQECANYNDVM